MLGITVVPPFVSWMICRCVPVSLIFTFFISFPMFISYYFKKSIVILENLDHMFQYFDLFTQQQRVLIIISELSNRQLLLASPNNT